MEAIFRRHKATAAEVLAGIPRPPSNSAVRATLRVLVGKRLLTYRREGRRYLYAPTVSRRRAGSSAAGHLLSTYFEGSVAAALTAMLQADRRSMVEADYRALADLIRKAARGGQP